MKVSLHQIKSLATACVSDAKARGQKLPHTAALELVAKGLGFANWRTLQALLVKAGPGRPSAPAPEEKTSAAAAYIQKAIATHHAADVGRSDIRLAHFEIVVAYEHEQGQPLFDPSTLDELERAIDTEGEIGTWDKTSDVPVPASAVNAVLVEMGNDGYFFGETDDDKPAKTLQQLQALGHGITLSDGGIIEPPEDDGTIRRRDVHGNTEEVRRPGDANYDAWAKEFGVSAELFEIVANLEEAGIEPEALDDLVHDVAEQAASSEMNQADSEAAADQVLEERSQSASDINNGGVSEQVKFLFAQLGVDAPARLRQHLGKSIPTWKVLLRVLAEDRTFLGEISDVRVSALTRAEAFAAAEQHSRDNCPLCDDRISCTIEHVNAEIVVDAE